MNEKDYLIKKVKDNYSLATFSLYGFLLLMFSTIYFLFEKQLYFTALTSFFGGFYFICYIAMHTNYTQCKTILQEKHNYWGK